MNYLFIYYISYIYIFENFGLNYKITLMKYLKLDLLKKNKIREKYHHLFIKKSNGKDYIIELFVIWNLLRCYLT